MNGKKFFSTRNVTYLAVLLAFVIVFQMISSFVPISEGVSLNLTLVPIVLGGILVGALGGTFLGLMFALIVVIMSVAMPSGMMPFIMEAPLALVFFIFSTLCRGAITGFLPALVYKAVAKKNARIAVFVASAVAPTVNTAVFVLSSLALFGMLPDMFDGTALEFFKYIVVTVSLINYIIELAINMILSPAVHTVVRVIVSRKSAPQNN